MPRKKKNEKLFKVATTIWFVTIIALVLFMYTMLSLNVLPEKYLIIGFIVILAIHLLYMLCIKLKKKALTIIFSVVAVLLSLVELFAIFKFGDLLSFINHNFGNNKTTYVYNIVAKSDSKYNSIDNIKNINIYYYKDLDDDSKLIDKVKDLKLVNYDGNVFDMLNAVTKDNEVALVSSAFYEVMIENDENYESNTKIIATYSIEVEEEDHNVDKDITKDSFLLFINGIDTRSGKLPARSLSDVNILMAVNPTKKEILMVATPRDYYVQIHGTKGLKDKLTHSGTYGGVKSTMATLEDLYDLKIDHYIRVNFNMVINLVDAIGGITLYNDQNYNITCHTNQSCTFKPGNNTVDGKCALAFARERYAYATGDKHRGENQEQVISKVFEKITSSSTLINDYSKILKALDGTFETSLEQDDITSLVKMQIDDMAKWTINQYNVSGTGSLEYTYSYPKQKLWVMFEDKKTVETAKEKIKDVLNK
ncbi:MAG: hypothetical protein E7159_01560 [Firmicutes bacterium]|nr:hypothetical protein [Bacillota bacterium]